MHTCEICHDPTPHAIPIEVTLFCPLRGVEVLRRLACCECLITLPGFTTTFNVRTLDGPEIHLTPRWLSGAAVH